MKVDLIGQKFGRLTVVEKLDSRASNRSGKMRYWRCECECGSGITLEFPTGRLTSGNVKSCGCYQKEHLAKLNDKTRIDITCGQKFGLLTTIEKVPGKHKRSGKRWLCECECGNRITVSPAELFHGRIKSCGCYRKKYSKQIFDQCHKKNFVEGTYPAGIINKNKPSNNKTGVRGVSIRITSRGVKRFYANIVFKGKSYHLGIFDTLEEAAEARAKAESEYFEKFLERYYKEHPDKN